MIPSPNGIVCPRSGCRGRLAKQMLEPLTARKLGKDFWLSCMRCYGSWVKAVDGKLRLVLQGLRVGSPRPQMQPPKAPRKAPKKQRKPKSKKKHSNVKLTEENVRVIRRRAKNGDGKVELAREFGVHPSTIYAIVNGKSWKGVE